MPHNARVFIIDDDAAMRDSLEFLLGAAHFAVTAFESVAEFLDALPHLGFGCVVTDIRMPGIDGIELLKRLKAKSTKLPVVVMTGHGDVPLAVEAMKLGAIEFLEKPFEDDRLVSALRMAFEQSIKNAKVSGDTADLSMRLASLSPRERQVMEGLIAGLSNKMIAKDHDISPRTVEVYRANVMTKMQAANISELVKLAIRSGVIEQ
ncbi:transcriptional regulatory protein FixJ [Labrys miyagiensis]|uniref:Transcriptional regulatory protein FixJ n=1 Tax=Labrys miyagiensis TaxID=346912 RepID=A0ABQ6CIH8_9HYPH|nr:response regulator FixJ [Labrys miyagiensis]GLS18524.1 transcriptional regulatory protein FixJ [Labrys miyagiensis]